MSALDPAARHRGRERAVQWLYQWELSGLDLDDVLSREHQVDVDPPDRERDAWAVDLVRGTAREMQRIDPLITQHATNWRIERMAVVDRVILRLGVYELLQNAPDAPPAVVIDEAVELARTFSADQAVAFVNGVLDAVHRGLSEAATDGPTDGPADAPRSS
ncbi:MAG: transcription antitermination factor NusB [Vicinamibacteraceae bacterium]